MLGWNWSSLLTQLVWHSERGVKKFATSRTDFLWRSMMHLGGLSLALTVLLFLTSLSWSGWETLSKMARSLHNIFFTDTSPRKSSFSHLLRRSVCWVCWIEFHRLPPAASAHNRKQDCTGHRRLTENPEHCPAGGGGCGPSCWVPSPVQFIVTEHSQVLALLHNIHTDRLDGNRGH